MTPRRNPTTLRDSKFSRINLAWTRTAPLVYQHLHQHQILCSLVTR